MKRNLLLKTKQKFFLMICTDVLYTLGIGIITIITPLFLASIFTPDWIYYKGYVLTWIQWTMIIIAISLFLAFISTWIKSRWKSSRKQAEAEVKNE